METTKRPKNLFNIALTCSQSQQVVFQMCRLESLIDTETMEMVTLLHCGYIVHKWLYCTLFLTSIFLQQDFKKITRDRYNTFYEDYGS